MILGSKTGPAESDWGRPESSQNPLEPGPALEHQKFSVQTSERSVVPIYGTEGLETPLAAGLVAGAGGFFLVP